MSLEQDFLHGYEKYSKHFDKWCEKASTILGKVTQCGIVETDNNGNALIAINRPDFGASYISKQILSPTIKPAIMTAYPALTTELIFPKQFYGISI